MRYLIVLYLLFISCSSYDKGLLIPDSNPIENKLKSLYINIVDTQDDSQLHTLFKRYLEKNIFDSNSNFSGYIDMTITDLTLNERLGLNLFLIYTTFGFVAKQNWIIEMDVTIYNSQGVKIKNYIINENYEFKRSAYDNAKIELAKIDGFKKILNSFRLVLMNDINELNNALEQKVKVPKDVAMQTPYDIAPTPVVPLNELINYPKKLISGGVEGKVIIECFINKFGYVDEYKIIKSSGYKELDDAALEAINKSSWNPATQRGVPMGLWMTIPINFTIKS